MASHSSPSASRAKINGGKGRHRKQPQRRIEPYAWLGAGAITLGVGAALSR